MTGMAVLSFFSAIYYLGESDDIIYQNSNNKLFKASKFKIFLILSAQDFFFYDELFLN